jgi:nickel-dependent lactate racemase
MVTLLRKKGDIEINLPKSWEVIQTIFREGMNERRTVEQLVTKAMKSPINGHRLEDRLKSGSRVAIVVDDVTRPTPIRGLLPPLLTRIQKSGVSKDNIDIVIGVGTHRPMTEEEIRERLGEEVVASYRVENHDAWSRNLVKVGELPDYGPIAINATVARADVRITLGSILPHLHNGFGGGPKSIMPGVCDYETILHHHLKNVVDYRAIVGNIEDNPFYDDLCQISRLTRVDFSIYCLFDSFGKVSGILTGNPFDVHRLGMQRLRQEVGVRILERADVTIVSSYPYDDGPQIVKPILPAAMVTKPGGTILLSAEVSAEMPESFLENMAKVRGDGGDEAEACIKEKLCRVEPVIEGVRGVDFNLAVVEMFFVSKRFRVVMSDKVLENAARKMGFEYAPDLLTAIEEEIRRKEKATVNVIPAGGYVFPILAEPFHLIGS